MEAKRVPRPKGGEELAQFISIKKIPSQSSLSHNIYAKQNSLPSISPSTSTKNLYPNVKSKLLENRNYQPPLHRPRSPRKNSPASQSLNLPPTTSKIVSMMPPRSFSSLSGVKPRISNNIYKNYELVQRRYREFKEQCLSDVLLRGIYSDRVIKDCFYREMERRTDLDYEHMEKIMTETLKELGINMDEANSKKSTVPKKETKVQQAERRVKTIKEKIEETTGSIEELDEDNQSQAESARSRTSSTASSTKSSSSKASKTDSSSSSTASESGSVISVHSSQLSTPPGGRSKKSENGSSPNGSTFSSIHEDDNKEQQTKSPPRDRQHSATTTSR
uniref:Uncharacterized protein n=1 Tax=Acrobeloides nanus TaxID=290746 RepID=A0A914C1S2_9BILA